MILYQGLRRRSRSLPTAVALRARPALPWAAAPTAKVFPALQVDGAQLLNAGQIGARLPYEPGLAGPRHGRRGHFGLVGAPREDREIRHAVGNGLAPVACDAAVAGHRCVVGRVVARSLGTVLCIAIGRSALRRPVARRLSVVRTWWLGAIKAGIQGGDGTVRLGRCAGFRPARPRKARRRVGRAPTCLSRRAVRHPGPISPAHPGGRRQETPSHKGATSRPSAFA
jgi:hypothetical protein